jgi:hypothetical protein
MGEGLTPAGTTPIKACLDLGHATFAEQNDDDAVFKEQVMVHNVGTVDRVIRIVAGLALIAGSLLGYIGLWGWIGVVVLATGLFRFCPAYLPFGFRTCAAGADKAQP